MNVPSLVYAIPLAAVISVVYTSTRFELTSRIIERSAIMFAKTVVGLVALYALLAWLSAEAAVGSRQYRKRAVVAGLVDARASSTRFLR